MGVYVCVGVWGEGDSTLNPNFDARIFAVNLDFLCIFDDFSVIFSFFLF